MIEPKFFKFLISGNPGTGKTGSLVSLIKLGYRLRIMDFDNGLDVLAHNLSANEKTLVDNHFFRGLFSADGLGVTKGNTKELIRALKSLMNKWPDGSNPSQWGPNDVLVIDTLTNFGRQAFTRQKQLLELQKKNDKIVDLRRVAYSAQVLVRDFISHITDEEFQTNVVVFTHLEAETERRLGPGGEYETVPTGNFYPYLSCGPRLAKHASSFFNTWIISEKRGTRRLFISQHNQIPTVFPSPNLPKELDSRLALAEMVKCLGFSPNQ